MYLMDVQIFCKKISSILGVIETKRGKGGGFHLNQHSEQINVGEIVIMLEGSFNVINCYSPKCKILPACQLKEVYRQATESFLNTLKQFTLSDLVDNKQGDLIELLNLTND